MAIKQDGPYDSRTLTKWFAGSSVLLAATTLAMVLQDWDRPWKHVQESFREIEVTRAEADLHEAKRKADEKTVLGPLREELDKAAEKVKATRDEVKKLEDDLEREMAKLQAMKLNYSNTKSKRESAGYFAEEYRVKHVDAKADEWKKKFDALWAQEQEDWRKQEDAQSAVNDIKKKIAADEAARTEAEKKLADAQAGIERAQKKLAQVDPTQTINPIVRVRDKPFVDFLDPSLRPKQIVLNDIKDDYYFAMVRKVDRCQTCHLAIDKKAFTGAIVGVEGTGLVSVASAKPVGTDFELTFDFDGHAHKETVPGKNLTQIPGHANPIKIDMPFTAHPRLDLFLSSSSPHPMERFGCTVCHLGEGQSIAFATAAHQPNDDEQREKWVKQHKWEPREHWNEPMWPIRYAEASCLLCHANNRPVPGANKLNFGREVWERVSCVGCHKMRGYEDETKRGPDLRKLASKLTPEFVAFWIEDPARFRPKTNMPKFFGVNPLSADEKGDLKLKGTDVDAREKVEIRSIVSFLFAKSEPFDAAEVRGIGDAARGERQFAMRGCVGCHRIVPTAEEAARLRTYAPDEFGPNLYNTGWKTNKAWLVSWIQNPKHYWSETKMPNLRLSATDALDIATYLTEGKGVKDESRPAGMADKLAPLNAAEQDELKNLIDEYLAKDYTAKEREFIMKGEPLSPKQPKLKDETARLEWLGEMTIGRAGCFGCHYVKGMETRPGIGRELSNIADKPLTQVDWGFESVPKDAETRPPEKIREVVHEWLHLKVEQPRIFDRGKIKQWLDRSRMPRFKLEPIEREALVTYLLGHTENRRVPQEYKYQPAIRKQYEIEGEYAILRNNCKACHLFAADKITVKTDKGWVSEELRDSKGEVVTSPITHEPVKVPAEVDGLVLLDNTGIKGKDGKPLYDEARAVIAVFGESKTLKDAVGSPDQPFRYVIAGPGESTLAKDYAAEAPLVGGEADVVKVLEDLPEGAFADHIGSPVPDAEARREKYLAAVKSMIGARNRGGTSLEKIIRARFKLGTSEKGQGFDPWSSNPEDAKAWDATNIAGYQVSLEEGKSYGPPHLIGEGRKVQPLWLQSFMREPVELRPWLEVRMPTFGFDDPTAQKFSRYFAAIDEDRRIQQALPLLAKIGDAVKSKAAGFQTRTEIQQKVADALDPLGVREYFAMTILDGVLNYAPRADVSLSRAIEEKTESYMAARESLAHEKQHQGWYSAAYRFYIDPQAGKCQSCHIVNGQEPGSAADKSSWAPDLARVRERIRPEYIRDWLYDPSAIVHGTKMPQLFDVKSNEKRKDLLGGASAKQIDAVADWLLAGVPSALEAFPASAKSGATIRLTSELLNLDGVTAITVVDGDQKIEVKDLGREKSAERTAAIRITLPNVSSGKKVLVVANDGRFQAEAEVQVE